MAKPPTDPGTADAWVQRFLTAAKQRYTTCELLNQRELFVDQMYLTGYVVECALKALILHDAPKRERRRVHEEITRGAGCHDYLRLKHVYEHVYERRSRTFPLEGTKILRRLMEYNWSTALRYEVGKGDPALASDFLKEAHTFLAWVKRRL